MKIQRKHLSAMDVSVLVELLALPIGAKIRLPSTPQLNVYSANPRVSRAQVNVYMIGDAVAEVLNGGLFQLITNSVGACLPDLPGAFRALGREREAKIVDEVCRMFPDAATLRMKAKRVKFASSFIVPGGWDGLASGKETALSKRLEVLEEKFSALAQSAAFFRAVARYVKKEAGSFEII